MRHRHHHKRKSFNVNKGVIKILIIGIFLWLSYNYYLKNSLDAIFTTLIQLPLINKVVEGYVYWIIILAICFGIWKLIDYIRFR